MIIINGHYLVSSTGSTGCGVVTHGQAILVTTYKQCLEELTCKECKKISQEGFFGWFTQERKIFSSQHYLP